MGTWGTGLYENDTTCDIRDTYNEFLHEKLNHHEAYEKTLAVFHELIGDDDEPLLWYALADTQLKTGDLIPHVKEKTLEWIKRSGGIALWKDSGNSHGWKKTLEDINKNLTKSNKSKGKKRLTEPKVLNHNLWNIGDLFALQFNSKESKTYGIYKKYIVIQKMGEGLSSWPDKNIKMRVCIFNKLFDDIPTLDDIDKIHLLPLDTPIRTQYICMSRLLILLDEKDYPAEQLTYIGKTKPHANKIFKEFEHYYVAWRSIELGLWNFFSLWQNIRYEEGEKGVFHQC